MLFLSLLLGLVIAEDFVFVERPDNQPTNDWLELGRSNPASEITLLFAVKQQNVDKLITKLLNCSDPTSDDYGNFLTTSEIQTLLAPKQESILKIQQWLFNTASILFRDVNYAKNNGDMLTVKTTIFNAEKLLNAQYYDYQHYETGDIASRIRFGGDYYVPRSVREHLDFVSPTHRFPTHSTLRKSVGALEVTPTFLRSLYNTGKTVGTAKKNIVGVASFRDQYYDINDLTTFWSDYDTEPTNVTNVPANQGTGHHLECELDTQYMSSMGQGIPFQPWYTGGINFPDALMEWSKDVLNANNPPLLFSVSYGTTESYYGADFIDRYNTELASMGTAGISVLFASGDSGAGGGCSVPPFEPDYPASSIYVTAVGGIEGGTAGKTPTGESVWVDGGGGFSNYGAIQSWQATAVANFLANCQTNLPPTKDFNASGRGYPDISAQSVDFVILVDGSKEQVDGTSCAAPTAGGVMGLINDARLNAGMAQLGFANPFIYQTAASNANAFNDVTSGYNKGCGAAKGFYACTGWDPASGWGSPDYTQLVTEALKVGEKTKKYVQY